MGKITSIEVQKRNVNRVNVYVDEAFTFACDAELIYKQGIKKDSLIDVEDIKEIVKEDEFIKCKNSALSCTKKYTSRGIFSRGACISYIKSFLNNTVVCCFPLKCTLS